MKLYLYDNVLLTEAALIFVNPEYYKEAEVVNIEDNWLVLDFDEGEQGFISLNAMYQ